MAKRPLLYTIGHSTRTLEDFLSLLGGVGIELVVDVRTVPRSRHVPHFESSRLARALKQAGIEYRHMKDLGGLRKPQPNSLNTGWRNLSFRGFADYMQSENFWQALEETLRLAKNKTACLMCAEAVPWRCHRSLIADALILRQAEARHIISASDIRPHELTPFASVHGQRVTYPPPGSMR
ncbi:MAG TPA: DUF488 domain-containing protein [Candidatus Acidoferrales bacterium]|nr:DUF488 domain-containing protein [Candidatus Acidoferrales bacterium]